MNNKRKLRRLLSLQKGLNRMGKLVGEQFKKPEAAAYERLQGWLTAAIVPLDAEVRAAEKAKAKA